jgi:hypothetical protein
MPASKLDSSWSTEIPLCGLCSPVLNLKIEAGIVIALASRKNSVSSSNTPSKMDRRASITVTAQLFT